MRARTSCRSSSGATRRATTWATRPRQQVPHLLRRPPAPPPTPSPLPPRPPIPDPKQPPTQTTPPNPTRASTPPDRRHPTDRRPTAAAAHRPTAAAAHRRPEGAGGEQLAGEAVQDRRQPGSLLRRHRAARAGVPAERAGLRPQSRRRRGAPRRPPPPPKPEAQALPHGVACSGRDARARGGCGKLRGRGGRVPSRKHPLPLLPARCLDAEPPRLSVARSAAWCATPT